VLPRCCALGRRRLEGEVECLCNDMRIQHLRSNVTAAEDPSGPVLLGINWDAPRWDSGRDSSSSHADRDLRVRALSESVAHRKCFRCRGMAASPRDVQLERSAAWIAVLPSGVRASRAAPGRAMAPVSARLRISLGAAQGVGEAYRICCSQRWRASTGPDSG